MFLIVESLFPHQKFLDLHGKKLEKMDFSKKGYFQVESCAYRKKLFFRQKQVDLNRKHIYRGFSMRGIDCEFYFDQKKILDVENLGFI